MISRLRFPLLAVSLLTAILAMWAGLVRMGWWLPLYSPAWIIAHGPLMVSGFLGTLISLERVVALGRRWMYLAPALSALGALGMLFGAPQPAVAALMSLASLGFLAICAVMLRRLPALFTLTMLLGALAWLAGSLLWWAGLPVFRIVLFWVAFLALTISAERLELSRVRRPPRYAERLFLVIVILLLAGLAASLAWPDWGARLVGLALLAMAAWLFNWDIARHTVRKAGLTRFIAACMLCGYIWLGVSGLFALWFGPLAAGFAYDALLHAFFLGFVFSMIFGHAPIIFPALLNRTLVYRPLFYSHLLLLQISLLLRILGDLGGWLVLRQWGGMLNLVAVLLFLVNTLLALLKRNTETTEIHRDTQRKTN
jgi:hypothetical protein